jgi:hypothetical protein
MKGNTPLKIEEPESPVRPRDSEPFAGFDSGRRPGFPLDYEELERWTRARVRAGDEVPVRGNGDRRVRQWGCSDTKQESPIE